MNTLFYTLLFMLVCKKYCYGNVVLLPETQLGDLISSNRLMLAYISPNEECDEDCQNSVTTLNSVGHSTAFLGLKVVHVYGPTLLKVLQSPNQPHLFYYRDGIPLVFESEAFEVDEISAWVAENQDVVLKHLDDGTFEHSTQASSGSTTGDWFILFYSKKCGNYLSIWETLALRLKQHKVIGIVDTDSSPSLKKRFTIKTCPTALFFRSGKIYSYTMPLNDLASLVNFAEGWYKNAPSQPVPSEHTQFDQLTGDMAGWLKVNPLGFVIVAGIFVSLLAMIYCCRLHFIESKPKLF